MAGIVITSPRADLSQTQRYLFRREVLAGMSSADDVLFIYGDTRFRLFVNGQIVTTGPVRSVPSRPRFDRVDLGGLFAPGRNVLVVELLVQRANNFQAMPGTPGGLAAWGTAGGERLDTGAEGWTVWVDESWLWPTPHFSFAQGPVEVCDLRRLPVARYAGEGDGWEAPVPAAPDVYGPFEPADLPLPAMTLEPFAQGWDLGLEIAREQRIAAALVDTRLEVNEVRSRPRFVWATFLHSPRAQEIDAGLFWGPNYLNGVATKQSNDPLCGNRQNARLTLREGWNLLYGEPEFFAPVWGVLLAFPRAAGLKVCAVSESGCPDVMRISALMDSAELRRRAGTTPPTDAAALDGADLSWKRVAADAQHEPGP